MCEARPEQDSNRRKSKEKEGGLWTKKGQFTWLSFHFVVFFGPSYVFTWLLLILNHFHRSRGYFVG